MGGRKLLDLVSKTTPQKERTLLAKYISVKFCMYET
jgi:hypothetical protein